VRWELAPALLATAASCALVIIAQSAATARSYALRYNDHFDSNRDMIGLAAANAAAACSGTFVVNGSPTKTEMVDFAGGRSQLAQVVTALIVLLVLLFFTGPLAHMPAVVLSAVVILIGAKLVDIPGLKDLWRKRRDEFWIAVATAAAVFLIGVEQGIFLAVTISLIDHLRRSYRPVTGLLTHSPKGGYELTPPAGGRTAVPGLMLYRFSAPLYYANAGFFLSEVLSSIKDSKTTIRWFVVRFDSIPDVDYTAAKTLAELVARTKDLGAAIVICDVTEEKQRLLDRYGLTQVVGAERLYPSAHKALEAYAESTPPATKNG
jgi:sulfate permease, SulP family